MRLPLRTVLLVAATCLSACGNDATSPPVGAGAAASADAAESVVLVSGPAVSGPLRPAVDAALADASKRTGRPLSALRVIDAESVVWPDGSMGCAEPGVVYTMAPVRGYRIRIQAGSETLAYHGREGAAPFFCPPDRVGASTPAGST